VCDFSTQRHKGHKEQNILFFIKYDNFFHLCVFVSKNCGMDVPYGHYYLIGESGVEMKQDVNELSYKIIGAAIEVHKVLGGPGLLESIYEVALGHELTLQGLNVDRQIQVPVLYKGANKRLFSHGYGG
jgi:hypothetical protein